VRDVFEGQLRSRLRLDDASPVGASDHQLPTAADHQRGVLAAAGGRCRQRPEQGLLLLLQTTMHLLLLHLRLV
jgi:hypothetical protein